MLQDYQQQPAAVYMSDSRSSEASVNRTIYTHMLGDYHPPQKAEDMKICYSALGVWEFSFNSMHATLQLRLCKQWFGCSKSSEHERGVTGAALFPEVRPIP